MKQPKNHPPLLAPSSLKTLAAPRRLSIHPESNQIRWYAQFLLPTYRVCLLEVEDAVLSSAYSRLVTRWQLTDLVHKPMYGPESVLRGMMLAVHSHSQSIYPTLLHIGGLSPTSPIHCLAVRCHKQRKEKHIVDIQPSNLPKPCAVDIQKINTKLYPCTRGNYTYESDEPGPVELHP